MFRYANRRNTAMYGIAEQATVRGGRESYAREAK
jgi:hypothetical protein